MSAIFSCKKKQEYKPDIMAELNTGKRLQPRVDLTAMVDLAFLLITFFMLTTSLNNPAAMDLAIPDKSDPDSATEFADNRTVTILIGHDNRLMWYWGLLEDPIEGPAATMAGKAGIRKVLMDMKDKVSHRTGNDEEGMMVIIRPGENSTYGNLVDVLDEMAILNVRQYMIGDISGEERELLKRAL